MKTKGLTFGEALEAMKAGKRVMRKNWSKGYYFERRDEQLQDEKGELSLSCLQNLTSLYMWATDWEIVEDKKREEEVHDIVWAMKQLKAGKTITRFSTPNCSWSLSKRSGMEFKLEDLKATDWLVVEKEKCTITFSGAYAVPTDEVVEQWAFNAEDVKKVKGLTFGEAIEAMRNGEKVRRNHWTNRDHYLYQHNGSLYCGDLRPGFPSEPDYVNADSVFADDWEIVR